MSVFLNLLTFTLAFHQINSLFKLVSCFHSRISLNSIFKTVVFYYCVSLLCCQTSLSLVCISKWTFQTSCLRSCLSANSRCSEDPCPLRLVHYRNGQCSSTAGSRLLANVLPQPSSVLLANVLPQPSSVLPQPSSVLPQLSSVLPQPSSVLPQPSSVLPQPSSVLPQPSSVLPQPSSVLPQPSSVLPCLKKVSRPVAAV